MPSYHTLVTTYVKMLPKLLPYIVHSSITWILYIILVVWAAIQWVLFLLDYLEWDTVTRGPAWYNGSYNLAHRSGTITLCCMLGQHSFCQATNTKALQRALFLELMRQVIFAVSYRKILHKPENIIYFHIKQGCSWDWQHNYHHHVMVEQGWGY